MLVLIERIKSQDVCEYDKFGNCKFNVDCEKHDVVGECDQGNTCPTVKICNLRHPKMWKRIVIDGYCGLGDKCASRHKIKLHSDHHETKYLHKDIKNMKTEIDNIKSTVNKLVSIKEDAKLLQN